MEATLFWIGCGLGVYGFALRKVFDRHWLNGRQALSIALHILFMGAVGALIGFVVSASTQLYGPTARFPVIGALIGIAWGMLQAWSAVRKTSGTQELVGDDLEWVETSFSAILLASVIMYAVVQAFKIPSGSMEDTLRIGDHLFVNKFIYGVRVPFTDKRVVKWRDVHRGDIVVFEAPTPAILAPHERERGVKKDFIKRAIGLPGDRVEVKGKKLYVNGSPIEEPYIIFRDPMTYPRLNNPPPPEEYQRLWESGEFSGIGRQQIGDNFGPVTVPPHTLFVMGDNRDGSFDSRFWGPMPLRYLKGKAWLVYWPFRRVKVIR